MDLPYLCEYSRSSRAKCKGCKLLIAQGILRLAAMVQSPIFDGKQPNWYHFDCFFKKQRPKTVDDIENFESLRIEDQDRIKDKLNTISIVVPDRKGVKRSANDKKIALEIYSIQYAKGGRSICRGCKLKILKDEIRISKKDFESDTAREIGGEDQWYHPVCFATLRCELGYFETGEKLPGYTDLKKEDQVEIKKTLKAIKQDDVPKDKKPKIEERDPNEKLYRKQNKIMMQHRDNIKILQKEELNKLLAYNHQEIPENIEEKLNRLADMMSFGALAPCVECKNGQLVFKKVGYSCTGNITEWTNCTFVTKDPKRSEVQIPKNLTKNYMFLKDYKPTVGKRVFKNVAPTSNIQHPTSNGKSNLKFRSRYVKSQPEKIKIKIRGGSYVDPESGLEDLAHVYKDYTTVLGITNVQRNKNSYYKLQILRSNSMYKTWLFRSWGRIGTTIGGTKCEEVDNEHDGINKFEAYYQERTGNDWCNRDKFVKMPGKMYPLDLDYSVYNDSLAISDTKSNIKQPIQDLIKLIFDVKLMEKTMIEFELDTEKMPLGKLSRKQIQLAYEVLDTLQNLINQENQQQQIVEATNRFYTYIPHNFGVDDVPILNDKEIIKQKLDMLDSLLEMEVAYNLMKTAGNDHSVDSYYKQLKTEIDVLDKKSKEFAIIQEYVKNTHAPTHTSYQLEIEEVYTIQREGEEERFKPFKKLPNRKLLWHGSRTTNFVGILSQGLKIAPPEAPASGYMFGKGIYFADMVSKSANYCCTTPTETTGLLLLCEVALGNIVEEKYAKFILELPQGKHSVKGLGQIHPNPSFVKFIDGAEVPLGKCILNSKAVFYPLLYNEYIIYDEAQVRIKYLIKANFKYKC